MKNLFKPKGDSKKGKEDPKTTAPVAKDEPKTKDVPKIQIPPQEAPSDTPKSDTTHPAPVDKTDKLGSEKPQDSHIVSPRQHGGSFGGRTSKDNIRPDALKIEKLDEEYLQSSLKRQPSSLKIVTPNDPIFFAIDDEEGESLVKLLEENSDLVNFKSEEGYTPLMFASERNNVFAVETLFKFGANPDDKTPKGVTALHIAAVNGHRDVVYQLLSRGAKAKDSEGNSALSYALSSKRFTIASDLLLFSHNINEQNAAGHTALHLACMKKDLETVEWLIKQGAASNLKDTLGNTPLIYAIEINDIASVKSFLNTKDCDWLVRNIKGQSILHIALLAKNSQLLELLADKKKEVLTKLLNDGDKVMNRTPLFYGVTDQDKIFSFLIMQPDINLNHQDSNGDTALHLAIKAENLTAIRLLMFGPHPANSELKNSEKQTSKALLKLKPELNNKLKDKKVGLTNFGSGDPDHVKL